MPSVTTSHQADSARAAKHAVIWTYLLFWYLTGATQFLIGISRTASFEGFKDTTITALLWLIPLLLLPQHAKKVTGACAALVWLLALPGFAYFLVYRQEITQSLMFIIFESNQSESREYFQNYFSWVIGLGLILFTVIPLYLWSNIQAFTVRKQTSYTAVLAILLVIFTYPVFKAIKAQDITAAYKNIDRHFAVASPWQLLLGYMHYQRELGEIERNLLNFKQIPPLTHLSEQAKPLPTTVVIVIGESTNRLHMGLYGYHRDTNPKLSSMRNELRVFDNVFSSRPNTIESLQQVLTFANQHHPDLYKSKPSLMAMMKQAGYRTYWVSNQQTLTARNTMLTTFAKQADQQVFLNTSRQQNAYSFDEKVLAPYTQILNRQEDKKLIVVHLLGTHMKYAYRYPPAFDVFHDNKGLPKGLSADQVETVNAYDNAVRYNDSIVYALIDRLKNKQQHSLLVYFSDHGEDVYDSAQHDFQGRNEASPTYAMYAIPFVVWHSPDWVNKQLLASPEKLHRQFDNADFIYSFSDLIGLRYDGFLPHESLVNEAFLEDPILVGNPYGRSLQQLVETKQMARHDYD